MKTSTNVRIGEKLYPVQHTNVKTTTGERYERFIVKLDEDTSTKICLYSKPDETLIDLTARLVKDIKAELELQEIRRNRKNRALSK